MVKDMAPKLGSLGFEISLTISTILPDIYGIIFLVNNILINFNYKMIMWYMHDVQAVKRYLKTR